MKTDFLPDVPPATFRSSKKLLAAALLFLAGAATPVAQGALTILSQDSRIYGSWKESGALDENGGLAFDRDGFFTLFDTEQSFDWSSSAAVPLHKEIASAPFKFVAGRATTSSFSLDMNADAWPSIDGNEGYLALAAQTITRFKPQGTRLTLEASGSAYYSYFDEEQDVWLRLRDVTSGETLLNVVDLWPWAEETASFSFTVDPAREYELDHGGFIIAFDAKDAQLTSRLEVASVPDHGQGTGAVALAVLVGAALARRRWALPHGNLEPAAR